MKEGFSKLSDAALADLRSGQLSQRGVLSCAFDAGYYALLGTMGAPDRDAEHPSPGLVRQACAALGIDAGVALQFIEQQYSPDDYGLPTVGELEHWALAVRRAVL
jgi:hypothetical protein